MAFTFGPLARPYASINTSSLWAVMSPSMSITRAASETSRTSNVVAASGIDAPFRAANGVLLVVRDRHEVGQSCDLEDLAVVVRQPECLHVDPARTGLGQEPDYERDAGAVDVVRACEVEDDGVGSTGCGSRVGLAQRILRRGVHVPGQVDHRDAVPLAHRRLELTRGHLRLLPGAARARRYVRLA